MRRIEADFSSDAAAPLLPAAGTAERARAEEMVEGCAALGKVGFQLALSARNESLCEPESSMLHASFEAALSDLDAQIAAGGGPFMLGADVSLVDCTYAPLLERWAVQLPLTQGFDLRPPQPNASPRWPALEAWSVATFPPPPPTHYPPPIPYRHQPSLHHHHHPDRIRSPRCQGTSLRRAARA